jgi:probable phosphoglycerate mutase
MTTTGTTTRFGLIRHAQTIWNREKRIQGHQDAPLTPEGDRQARNWRAQLMKMNWDRILTSDTGRALKTAERINAALKLPISSDPRLREQDWGSWTGKTKIELKREAREDLAKARSLGWEFRPPGGENRRQVWSRSLEALKAGALNWPGKTILVVTHEGVIRSLIYRLRGRHFLPNEAPLIRAYHLHWLRLDSAGLQIERINALALKKTP